MDTPTLSRTDAVAPHDHAVPGRPRWLIAFVVIASFLAVNAIGLVPFRWIATTLELTGWPRIAALALSGYGLYLIVPLAVAAWVVGRQRVWTALGLAASPWPALALALCCTAVVLVWMACTAPLHPLDDRLARSWMATAVLPGIAEELLFRGFLFGFLFRYAGWGFLPAALLASAVFGIEHLYQGGDAMEAAGIALITGLGGLWWSWLLVEWRWNLWVPIAFHVLMNGWFASFDAADNALGGIAFVLVRVLCVVVSVVVTVVVARRRGRLRVRGSCSRTGLGR